MDVLYHVASLLYNSQCAAQSRVAISFGSADLKSIKLCPPAEHEQVHPHGIAASPARIMALECCHAKQVLQVLR